MARRPLSIVIIEDSQDDADLLIAMLRRRGVRLTYAVIDTEQAYRRELAKAPDLIFVDQSVPGIPVDSAIRLRGELSPTSTLLVISGGNPRRGSDVGDGFVSKMHMSSVFGYLRQIFGSENPTDENGNGHG